MGRELPMFQQPSAGAHGVQPHLPPTIAMGGGSFDAPAADGSAALRRHPEWIKARLPSGDNYHDLKRMMRGLTLNTVCEEARCPNIGECWEQRTATIMILGDVCTRACGFCAVKTGRPTWNDEDEPRRVADAVAHMNLDHVVVTSVARDDLPDGGAHIFAETIRALRHASPHMGVEVLIPDFNGRDEPLLTVMEAAPDILNHNIETVERLQKPVRKRAQYARSLGVLATAKRQARALTGRDGTVHTKSSLMVGLGETRARAEHGVRRPARGRLRHPDHRPVPAPVGTTSGRRALLSSQRIRRYEGRGCGSWLQARRIGPARQIELPRPRSGAGGGAPPAHRTPSSARCQRALLSASRRYIDRRRSRGTHDH